MLFTRAVLVSIGTLSVMMNGPALDIGMAANSPMTVRTHLLLKRGRTTEGSVIGRLYVNGQFECYTLENKDYLIPKGTFSVVLYRSPKIGVFVPLLRVPGHSYVEIHPGNFKEDARRCIVIGRSHTDKSVVNSRGAFSRLMRHLVLPCEITIIDG